MKRTKRKKLAPTKRLLLTLLALLCVVVVGTVGFILIDGRPLLDSVYMTLATISTLGMLAGGSAPISRGEQFWIIALIIVGVGIAMVALSTLAAMVIEGQLRSILGRRQVDMKIASLRNHIIVCGGGRMGSAICANLRLRHTPLVVVDNNTDATAMAEANGYLYILGDASEETVLRDAGIEHAKAIVAALPSDADNVFVTLLARDLNEDVFIAARLEKPGSEARLLRAGVDKAICPLEIGATRLANILTRPAVVEFIDFAAHGLELEAEQFHLQAQSKLVGQTLRQANLPRTVGVLIIALKNKDGQTVFNPEPDTVLQADDTLIITGRVGSLAKLEKQYS